MISVVIIEFEEYDFISLTERFACDENEFESILRYLIEMNFVNKKNKQQKYPDFSLDDIQTDNFEETKYVFTYVGIILISKWVIKCYPKYLDEEQTSKEALTQVMKVLKKYKNSKIQNFSNSYEIKEKNNHSLISVMIALIEDYYENGIYTNFHKIVETNGVGEILWDKTINETNAFIQNNMPYYLNFYTKKRANDAQDYFRLLHEVILTKCSKELENADILDYFDLTPINLSNKNLDEFGDVEYIESKINQELNVQFNSHKQSLLKKMLFYINESDPLLGNDNFIKSYGTHYYNFVWEEMCSRVFNNKRDIKLRNLELPNGELHEKYENVSDKKLVEITETPTWFIFESEDVDGGRLKPDTISFNKTDEGIEFLILDAKYYHWESDRKPGVNDIIKQYLYEHAFKEFIKLNGFTNSKNCFLFPSTCENIVNKGYVDFSMIKQKLHLDYIHIILLPAKLINKYFLEDKEIDNISEVFEI